MFELHIYGPAFGLPSIDVGCLAAIALLQACFDGSPNAWSLVPSNDPSISPFNELPALKDGDLWVAGFRNIADYISSCHSDELSNQRFTFSLKESQSADNEAYTSFLESRGLPLLDLSVYVSSDNYTTLTRSALSDLLPWPQSWILPQKIRDNARKRSEHLGLSGLDVDAAREKELKKENEGLAAAIPKSLRIPKKSVTGLLGSSAEQTRFRLEVVTADFFEPLQEQLAQQKYFLGERMTLLDCLALAVLAQMSVDEMPQPWLRHALQKHPKLWNWTQENTVRVFGATAALPWALAGERSWLKVTTDILDSVAEAIPVTISSSPIRVRKRDFDDNKMLSKSTRTVQQQKHAFYSNHRNNEQQMRGIVTTLLSSAGVIGILIYKGILVMSWPARRAGPMRQGFGEAGSFLGLR